MIGWSTLNKRSTPDGKSIEETVKINEYKNRTEGLLIASDFRNSPKGAKLFKFFENGIGFISSYLREYRDNGVTHNKYEVIPEKWHRKMYFDIDIDLKDEETNFTEQHSLDVINDIILNYTEKYKELFIWTSHGLLKWSYHLIFHGYCYENVAATKMIFDKVLAKMQPKNRQFVDPSVYSKNRCFRLPFSTKIGQDRIKVFSKYLRFRKDVKPELLGPDAFVVDENDYHRLVELFSRSLISWTIENELVILTPPVESVPKKIFDNVDVDFEMDEVDDLLQKWDEHFFDKFLINDTSNGIISCSRLRPSFCKLCERPHHNENPYVRITGNNRSVFFNCRRSKDNKGQFVGNLDKFTDSDDISDILASKPDSKPIDTKKRNSCTIAKRIMNRKKKSKIYRKAFDIYNSLGQNDKIIIEECAKQYIGDIEPKKRLYFIKSPTNTGKTTSLMKFFKISDNRSKSILMVSTKITFSKSVAAFFAELGFVDYTTLPPGTPIKNHRIIISAESFHRISRSYDIVVLDEFVSFLAQFESPTHKDNLKLNKDRFISVLSDASQIIGLDADLDSRALNFIHSNFPTEDIELIWNTLKRTGTAVGLKQDTFLHKMLKCLENGENIPVVCTNKEMLKTYQRIFEEKNYSVLAIHGDMDDNSDIFKNINEEVKKYRVLLYTSSLCAGVDINLEHFNTSFMYLSAVTVVPRDSGQMRDRVRMLTTDTFYYCINNCGAGSRLPDDRDDLIYLAEHNMKLNSELATNLNEIESVNNNGIYYWSFDKTNCWFNISIDFKLERINALKDYETVFMSHMEDKGYKVIPNYTSTKPDDIKHFQRSVNGILGGGTSKYSEKYIGYLQWYKYAVDQMVKTKINNKVISNPLFLLTGIEEVDMVKMDDVSEDVELFLEAKERTKKLRLADLENAASELNELTNLGKVQAVDAAEKAIEGGMATYSEKLILKVVSAQVHTANDEEDPEILEVSNRRGNHINNFLKESVTVDRYAKEMIKRNPKDNNVLYRNGLDLAAQKNIKRINEILGVKSTHDVKAIIPVENVKKLIAHISENLKEICVAFKCEIKDAKQFDTLKKQMNFITKNILGPWSGSTLGGIRTRHRVNGKIVNGYSHYKIGNVKDKIFLGLIENHPPHQWTMKESDEKQAKMSTHEFLTLIPALQVSTSNNWTKSNSLSKDSKLLKSSVENKEISVEMPKKPKTLTLTINIWN